MSDWRQIQARIRKAKTSTDPATKLSELYQRTRDAMVAWELGAVEEKGGRTEQAIKWYTTAAQRFRRAEWKKKAEEALLRLGAEMPAASDIAAAGSSAPPSTFDDSRVSLALGEIPEEESPQTLSREPAAAAAPEAAAEFAASSAYDAGQPFAGPEPGNAAARTEGQRKRRRGRRGGRGRHRKPAGQSPSLPAQAFTPPPPEAPTRPQAFTPRPSAVQPAAYAAPPQAEEQRPEVRHDRRASDREEFPAARPDYASQLPSERTARGRAGDPALASRMAHLESMLRRLLSSPLHRLDEVDDAPAGPGVFLLTDSDQTTSYYIESCQTLRIGLGNLVRGSRGGGKGRRPTGRGYSEGGDLKEKLADHLGINQSKVSQYMKDHCVVRWIQLDEDAPHLAHFAIAVLRSALNLD